MKKEDIFVVTAALVAVLVFASLFVWMLFFKADKHTVTYTGQPVNSGNVAAPSEDNTVEQEATTTEWRCLGDDETAEYTIEKTGIKNGNINISIKDNNTKIERVIVVNDVRTNYRPIELHKCGIYYVRLFNYDSISANKVDGYKSELYKSDYNGHKKK
ncbi:MAG: hypothetical protein V1867_03115 [Candidatus Falkowbacteria bacterium]